VKKSFSITVKYELMSAQGEGRKMITKYLQHRINEIEIGDVLSTEYAWKGNETAIKKAVKKITKNFIWFEDKTRIRTDEYWRHVLNETGDALNIYAN
jgi:hypothetical protein